MGRDERPGRRHHAADQFDSQLLPWLFWSYYENVILDPHLRRTPDNLRGPVLDVLTRGRIPRR